MPHIFKPSGAGGMSCHTQYSRISVHIWRISEKPEGLVSGLPLQGIIGYPEPGVLWLVRSHIHKETAGRHASDRMFIPDSFRLHFSSLLRIEKIKTWRNPYHKPYKYHPTDWPDLHQPHLSAHDFYSILQVFPLQRKRAESTRILSGMYHTGYPVPAPLFLR